MSKPLYIKFKAGQGCYLFDSCTNEILQVSSQIYTMIDDFMVLNDGDVIQKYSGQYDMGLIRESIAALKQISQDRFLYTDYRQDSRGAVALCCEQRRYDFDEFLKNHSAMLTLELTQQCNLNCSYCIYGAHYNRHQPRIPGALSPEIGELAIKSHLDKPHSGRIISFYGGEPLLEFELMKHLITYAEQHCLDIGKEKPSFSLTTNGTLLNDSMIHFFVKHDCNVLFSVDGDRKTHDKNRVYKSNGKGSFADIESNMQRFSELYPSYGRCGILLTVTGSTDVYQANEFLKKHATFFPAQVVNFVDSFLGINSGTITGECENKNCAKTAFPKGEQTYPDFLKREINNEKKWQICESQFLADVLSMGTQVRNIWPLFYHGYFLRMRLLHERKICAPQSDRVTCCCVPGSIRLYCDIKGNYYPCERIEFHDTFKIGNVWDGIDAVKVSRMINYMSEVTECGKCVGKHLCAVCPASISTDDGEHFKDIRLNQRCLTVLDDFQSQLSQYVTLLEAQPHFFPNISDSDKSKDEKDWIKHILFLTKDINQV